jgi:hypothetical protein
MWRSPLKYRRRDFLEQPACFIPHVKTEICMGPEMGIWRSSRSTISWSSENVKPIDARLRWKLAPAASCRVPAKEIQTETTS